MIIGEFGSNFCDSVGITRSMSSIPHELVQTVDAKADIYTKLGIDCDLADSLPEITILRNLELNFDFAESTDEITKNNNFIRLSNLFLDLLIINREIIEDNLCDTTNHNKRGKRIEVNNYINRHIDNSIDTKIIDLTIHKTVQKYALNAKNDHTNFTISISSYIKNMNFSRHYHFNDNTDNSKIISDMKKVLSDALMIRVKRCIDLLIKEYKDSQYLSVSNEKLQPRLDKLHSKIMDFFDIPDQSQQIDELKQENAQLKSVIDGYRLRIDEYKKSLSELTALTYQLNKLIE